MMKSSNANSTPIILTALLLAVLCAIYYFVVMPKMDEVSSLESAVATSEANIASLNEQIEQVSSVQDEDAENEFVIRKKLPSKRQLEQLLLNIEEMEYVTGTRITSVSFNNYDALVSGSTLLDPNAPPVDPNAPAQDPNAPAADTTATDGSTQEATTTPENTNGESTDPNSSETAVDEVPVSSIDVATLPPNLKMVTFNIEVEAPDEQSLIMFLKEIEKLERIMNVETIDFELHGEENTFTPDASKVVATSVQVTTFYYE